MSKSSIAVKVGLGVLLVAIADGFFYKQPVGWTAGLYAGLLLAVLIGLNKHLLQSTASKLIAFSSTTLIGSLIEAPHSLTVGLFSLGIITLLILQKRKRLSCALFWLKDVSGFFTQGANQWHKDIHKISRARKRKAGHKIQFSYAVIPVCLTLAFGFLFAQANPIIAQVLDGIDWDLLLRLLSVWLWMFWFVTAVIIWALLRPRFMPSNTLAASTSLDLDRWFNQQTIVLSLLLFNGIFALQNGLDIVFLWSGETIT